MNAIRTEIDGVLLLVPKVFSDDRGFFYEAFNQREFNDAVGKEYRFVQDNHSASCKDVLRGLHYQVRHSQGKLVRVIAGSIHDVAVDLRQNSPSFGRHIAVQLSSANKHELWIPPGFAHGFLVLSDYAEVLYKATDFYAPKFERSVVWNDPDLAISWPIQGKPILSHKDAQGGSFANVEPQE